MRKTCYQSSSISLESLFRRNPQDGVSRRPKKAETPNHRSLKNARLLPRKPRRKIKTLRMKGLKLHLPKTSPWRTSSQRSTTWANSMKLGDTWSLDIPTTKNSWMLWNSSTFPSIDSSSCLTIPKKHRIKICKRDFLMPSSNKLRSSLLQSALSKRQLARKFARRFWLTRLLKRLSIKLGRSSILSTSKLTRTHSIGSVLIRLKKATLSLWASVVNTALFPWRMDGR